MHNIQIYCCRSCHRAKRAPSTRYVDLEDLQKVHKDNSPGCKGTIESHSLDRLQALNRELYDLVTTYKPFRKKVHTASKKR